MWLSVIRIEIISFNVCQLWSNYRAKCRQLVCNCNFVTKTHTHPDTHNWTHTWSLRQSNEKRLIKVMKTISFEIGKQTNFESWSIDENENRYQTMQTMQKIQQVTFKKFQHHHARRPKRSKLSFFPKSFYFNKEYNQRWYTMRHGQRTLERDYKKSDC